MIWTDFSLEHFPLPLSIWHKLSNQEGHWESFTVLPGKKHMLLGRIVHG